MPTIFSIAAGTDISEEFYTHPYLYLSLSGETRVEAPSLRVLPEGSALLIPQKDAVSRAGAGPLRIS